MLRHFRGMTEGGLGLRRLQNDRFSFGPQGRGLMVKKAKYPLDVTVPPEFVQSHATV